MNLFKNLFFWLMYFISFNWIKVRYLIERWVFEKFLAPVLVLKYFALWQVWDSGIALGWDIKRAEVTEPREIVIPITWGTRPAQKWNFVFLGLVPDSLNFHTKFLVRPGASPNEARVHVRMIAVSFNLNLAHLLTANSTTV